MLQRENYQRFTPIQSSVVEPRGFASLVAPMRDTLRLLNQWDTQKPVRLRVLQDIVDNRGDDVAQMVVVNLVR